MKENNKNNRKRKIPYDLVISVEIIEFVVESSKI
jgi:hypothetical protein